MSKRSKRPEEYHSNSSKWAGRANFIVYCYKMLDAFNQISNICPMYLIGFTLFGRSSSKGAQLILDQKKIKNKIHITFPIYVADCMKVKGIGLFVE